jgi:hypothetical protein
MEAEECRGDHGRRLGSPFERRTRRDDAQSFSKLSLSQVKARTPAGKSA